VAGLVAGYTARLFPSGHVFICLSLTMSSMYSSVIQRPTVLFQSGGTEIIKLPEIDRETAIGICVAIAGNVIISLAINLQKLAHVPRRLDSNGPRKSWSWSFSRRPYAGIENVADFSVEEQEDDNPKDSHNDRSKISVGESALPQRPVDTEREATSERQPLLSRTQLYSSSPSDLSRITNRMRDLSPSSLFRSHSSIQSHNLRLPTRVPSSNTRVHPRASPSFSTVEAVNETDYLKSKLW
jgi:magnesium transporter